MKQSSVVAIISFLLAGILGYAAITKLVYILSSKTLLWETPFPLLYALAPWITWLLPLGLILSVFLLVVSTTRLMGLFSALFIFTNFSLYIRQIREFGKWLPDTHQGMILTHSWNLQFYLYMLLSIAAIAGILMHDGGLHLKQRLPHTK
jgi:hypothetical protein